MIALITYTHERSAGFQHGRRGSHQVRSLASREPLFWLQVEEVCGVQKGELNHLSDLQHGTVTAGSPAFHFAEEPQLLNAH